MKNAIEIEYSSSPELKSLFAGKDIGAKVRLTVVFQLNERGDQSAKGTIEEVEDSAEEEIEVEPTKDEPVMVIIKKKDES